MGLKFQRFRGYDNIAVEYKHNALGGRRTGVFGRQKNQKSSGLGLQSSSICHSFRDETGRATNEVFNKKESAITYRLSVTRLAPTRVNVWVRMWVGTVTVGVVLVAYLGLMDGWLEEGRARSCCGSDARRFPCRRGGAVIYHGVPFFFGYQSGS